MNEHEDTDDLDICSCGYEWQNIWDMMEHRNIEFSTQIHLSDHLALDLFYVLHQLWNMMDVGDYESVKGALQGIAAAIYTASTGEIDEMMISSFTDNLDEKLRELLDDETNNDN